MEVIDEASVDRYPGNTLLCWRGSDERTLMERFRLWARRVGAEASGNGRERRLPAVLFPEQAVAYEAASARGGGGAAATRASRRGAVLADLTARGFVVGSGCRYGGDFVIYAARPDEVHSSHTVRVVPEDECVVAADVAALCRVQGNVLKKALLAAVDPATHAPTYVQITYDAALSTDPMKKPERRLARELRKEDVDYGSPPPPGWGTH